MNIELTNTEYRRLLDLIYIGNYLLNFNRGNDRIGDYDAVESKLFALADSVGMGVVTERRGGIAVPSQRFEDGGIGEVISGYEDAVFFDLLAEELARRDIEKEHGNPDDFIELNRRMDEYITEFEQSGIDHIVLEK